MSTNLKQFLASISPLKTLDDVDQKIDEVLGAFPFRAARVESATEFREVLVQAWRHFYGRLWGLDQPLPEINPELEWDWCQRLLNAMYGGHQGWRTALELTSSGVESGLYGVVKDFCYQAAKEYLDSGIGHGIHGLWDRLSYDERVTMVDEYLGEYGHLLPEEVKSRSRTDWILDFPEILREHPRMLQRAGRIGH